MVWKKKTIIPTKTGLLYLLPLTILNVVIAAKMAAAIARMGLKNLKISLS